MWLVPGGPPELVTKEPPRSSGGGFQELVVGLLLLGVILEDPCQEASDHPFGAVFVVAWIFEPRCKM